MNWQTVSFLLLVIGTHSGLAQKTFELKAKADNLKCMAVEGGSKTDGAGVVVLSCGGSSQWYRVKSKADPEYFNLLTKNADKCLSVPAGNVLNGAALVQLTCTDQGYQQWKFVAADASGSLIYLKNKFSGKCVSVNDEIPKDGSKLVQWDCVNRFNQQFNVFPPIVEEPEAQTPEPDAATTEIRTFGEKNKCLVAAGGNTLLLPCGNSGPDFQWYTVESKSDPEYYNLFGKNADNKCMSVPVGNTTNGAGIVQSNCADMPSQQWKHMASDVCPNVFYLKNKFSGKCITVKEGDLKSGSEIVQWDCTDRYNQQFYLPTTLGNENTKPDDTKVTKKKAEVPFGTAMEVKPFGASTQCLTLKGANDVDGADIGVATCGPNGANFHWYTVQSKAQPEYRNFFRKGVNDKCLTTPGGGFADSTVNLVQWTCADSEIQQWKFVESETSPGAFSIENKFNDLCVTFKGAAEIVHSDCEDASNQKFYFYPKA